MIDDFNRQRVAHRGRTSDQLRAVGARVFELIKRDQGLPKVICTDNGAELLGEAIQQWSNNSNVV